MMNMDTNERDMAQGLVGLFCDRTVSCDVSGDFTIPEHQPEIRRLLSVSEKVLPPAKYVSSSGVECNGTVDYRVIYVGTDGGLWGASFSSEYELKAPADENGADASGGADTVVSVVSDGSTSRVSSPRRLNIRSRLCARVRAFSGIDTEPQVYGETDTESIERLLRSTENASVCAVSSDVLELHDEVGGLSEDSRVISADGTVLVNDIRKGGEGLSALGDVTLKLLVCREGQRAECMTRKIPFEGLLECDRPVGDALCRVVGTVTDIAVNVEDGRALCDISMVLHALAASNEERSYVADVYSVERECQCDTRELSLPVLRVCMGGNFSQSERIALSETGVPEGAELVDICGSVRFVGCERSGGKYMLSGESKYTLIWEKDGEYGSAGVELPVKYGADGEDCEGMDWSAIGEVIACRGRVDGELLCIDSEIGVAAEVFGRKNVRVVREARFGEPFAREKNRMVVYYPAEGESVWEVAKKYHVKADSLTAEKNYYLF